MNDEFEQRLKRQPLRQVPAAWRAEILAAANASARPAVNVARPGLLSILNHQLSTIFWPHPKAWAGLAAVWLLILGLHICTRDDSGSRVFAQVAPPSPEVIVELKKQWLLFAELVGTREEPVADRSKNHPPRPHTQRLELLAA